MVLSVAAALLVLVAGQSGAAGERRAEEDVDVPVEDGSAPEAKPSQPAAADALTGPPGVPFMPSVGLPGGISRGMFLDVALLSQVRARTLQPADGSTTWGTDLEVTPGIAFAVGTPSLTLSVGYAPRITVPFNVGDFQLAVLNRATFQGEWRPDPLWTVTALGIFVVGDYSQLVPASTPGGAGPLPPVLNPVRSFETYPYVGIDTLLRVETALSHRSHLRLGGGYFDVGGTGTAGQIAQPRTWGPQAEAGFDWDASRAATLSTAVVARNWMMVGDFSIFLASFSESWKQAWSQEFSTRVLAGAGLSNRDIESVTALSHVAPVAGLQIDYHPESREGFRLTLDATLAPYVDTYLEIPYQRFVASLALGWRPSEAWQLGLLLSGVLAPYSVRAPESYGTAGLSANYAPLPFLILTLGGFSQVQFQGSDATTGTFRQWTGYFSVALVDRLAL